MKYRVDALVRHQAGNGQQPAAFLQAIAGPNGRRVDPRAKVLGIGPQREKAHIDVVRSKAQLFQHDAARSLVQRLMATTTEADR